MRQAAPPRTGDSSERLGLEQIPPALRQQSGGRPHAERIERAVQLRPPVELCPASRATVQMLLEIFFFLTGQFAVQVKIG